MTTAIPLTACIITFNEADRIGACLDSLDFCDDILVVDSGSTDDTVSICQAHGARVLVRPFDGFQAQKQFAVDNALHDWVLCMDADERISPELRNAIERERSNCFARANGYRFDRLSEYFGRFLHHGNPFPDRQMRLFDRRQGGWQGQRQIHERATVQGKVVRLEGVLIHHPYRSFFQLLEKKQKYARMMATYAWQEGERASLAKLLLAPAWRFVRGYALRRGFLDGWPGLIEALVSANYVAQKTIMLWLLENGQPVTDPPRVDPDAMPSPPTDPQGLHKDPQ